MVGLEPATSESLVRDLTTTPPSHTVGLVLCGSGGERRVEYWLVAAVDLICDILATVVYV